MADETMPEKREDVVARAEETHPGHAYVPNVDIIEKPDKLLLMADVPGASADGISINYDKGVLTIHAKVAPRIDEHNVNFLLREYGVGDFRRAFHIGEGIDSSRISAEVKGGVLMLDLPKAASARPRKIEVKGE
jgi:HSP20 family protein